MITTTQTVQDPIVTADLQDLQDLTVTQLAMQGLTNTATQNLHLRIQEGGEAGEAMTLQALEQLVVQGLTITAADLQDLTVTASALDQEDRTITRYQIKVEMQNTTTCHLTS